jgi:hypothetical protein
MKPPIKFLATLAIMLSAATAFAQSPNASDNAQPGVAWTDLNPEQQKLLANQQATWAQLPPGRQTSLARGAKRFIGMTPEERRDANQRFGRWRELDDTQRDAIRGRYQQFRDLRPEDQARIRSNFRRFGNMNEAQRERLRQRWQSLPPTERARVREQLPPRRPPPKQR